MITKGTKIELIAPMGIFTNVGEICEVQEVMPNGMICFRLSKGLGYMTYDEFETYFKEYNEIPKTIRKKVTWTPWKELVMQYTNIEGNKTTIPIKYRYNDHRIDMRTNFNNENIRDLRTRVTCHKTDKFVLSKGVQLGCARLKLKIFTKELEEMKNNM